MDGGVWWVHGVAKSWMQLGPSCYKQDCRSSLVPWLGIKPRLLYWEQGVLTPGPPGKCPQSTLFNHREHLLLEIQSMVSSFLLPTAKHCLDLWKVHKFPNQHLSNKCCPNRLKATCPLLRVPLFLPNYVVLARWSLPPEEATWFTACLSTLPDRMPLPISVASGAPTWWDPCFNWSPTSYLIRFLLNYFFFFFLNLLAMPCGMWNLCSPAPTRGGTGTPLHWKCAVLTTGPPGKSQLIRFRVWDPEGTEGRTYPNIFI